MANTKKKTDDLDYTNQPQATTAEDVNNQDARTRLWQSLSYGYNNQLKQSNKAYDQAYSQANRQALKTGMQRSSYTNQMLANLDQQRIEANNNILSAQIADYQNRIGEIENQEKEDERWERQFAETQKQNEWNRTFQEKQADQSQTNWLKEYEANRSDTTWNQQFQESQAKYQQEQDNLNRAFQKEQFEYGKTQDELANALQREQFEHTKEQDAVANAYQQALFGYQKEQDAVNQAFQQEQFAYTKEKDAVSQAFAEKQLQIQQDQFREEYEYKRMSDAQQYAFNAILTAAANGGDVSDDLLKQAGLSRQDYNAMKAQTQTSTGGYYGGGKKSSKGGEDTDTTGNSSGVPLMHETMADFYNELFGGDSSAKVNTGAVGTKTGLLNFGKPLNEGYVTVNGKRYSPDEYKKLMNGNNG